MTWQRVTILGFLVAGALGALAMGSTEMASLFGGAAALQGGYSMNGHGAKKEKNNG